MKYHLIWRKRIAALGMMALLALLGSLQIHPARARDQMDDVAAQAWGELTGRAVNDFVNLRNGIENTNREIDQARRAFFEQYPHGAGVDAAKKRFDDLLLGKDLLYLGQAVMLGFENRQYEEVFRRRGTVGPFLLSGDIDGGIPGAARSAFIRLVGDMRADIRADLQARGQNVGRDEDPLFVLPAMFIAALKKNQATFRAYQQVRDYDEFRRAGKQMSELKDPREFVLLVLQSQRHLDPDKAAADYEALSAAIGEAALKKAAAAVAQIPQDEHGSLDAAAVARLGLVFSSDLPKDEKDLPADENDLDGFERLMWQPAPDADGKTIVWGGHGALAVLRALWSRDNPRVAALFAMAYDARSMSYATAWRRLQRIAAAVGEARLKSAAAEVAAAPRRRNGMLITPVPPGDAVWMYDPSAKLKAALLAGDDAKMQVRYFIATDWDTPDAAAIEKRYQELAQLKGEQELFKSAAKLRAAAWKPRAVGIPTDRVVLALGKMLGVKGEPNLHYLQWAGCGPGTTVTYDVELYGMRANAAGARHGFLHMKREVRVVSASADSIVLSVTESKEKSRPASGRGASKERPDKIWEASPAKQEKIDAYHDPLNGKVKFDASLPLVPGGWLGFDHIGPKIDRQGIASILVDGKVVRCTRSIWLGPRPEKEVHRGGGPGEADYVLKEKDIAEVWTNPDAPGWVAKAVRGIAGSKTIIRLLDYELKPAGGGAAHEPAKSIAWMRSTEELKVAAKDPERLQDSDRASRAWLKAPVGTSVTHLFHSNTGKGVDARSVTTLAERDEDMSLVRQTWYDGDKVTQWTADEIRPADADFGYLRVLVAWVAFNRSRNPAKFDLSKQKPSSATVMINGQPIECQVYDHVPLAWLRDDYQAQHRGKFSLQNARRMVEQLILSDSVPGAIVHLSASERNDPGWAWRRGVTYSIEGLDVATLPDVPKVEIKPEGGNFAIDQELLIDKRGNWLKGKILRFTQLPKDGGGKYLIRVGRNPTWYNEDWLREHSRPVSTSASAGDVAVAGAKPQQSPHPSGAASASATSSASIPATLPPEQRSEILAGDTVQAKEPDTGKWRTGVVLETRSSGSFVVELWDGKASREWRRSGQRTVTVKSDELKKIEPMADMYPQGTVLRVDFGEAERDAWVAKVRPLPILNLSRWVLAWHDESGREESKEVSFQWLRDHVRPAKPTEAGQAPQQSPSSVQLTPADDAAKKEKSAQQQHDSEDHEKRIKELREAKEALAPYVPDLHRISSQIALSEKTVNGLKRQVEKRKKEIARLDGLIAEGGQAASRYQRRRNSNANQLASLQKRFERQSANLASLTRERDALVARIKKEQEPALRLIFARDDASLGGDYRWLKKALPETL